MLSYVCFLLAPLLVALTGVPARAAQIYTVFFDNRFGTIDDSSGAFTQLSTLPIARAGGIAYDNGKLYAQDLQSNLIAIDPFTGKTSKTGGSGHGLSSVGFAGSGNGLFEVDYLSNLYSINRDTGEAVLVGATKLAPNYGQWDTSLSDDGTDLYFTAGDAGEDDELYRIDPSTGFANDLGSTGVAGIAGSAIVNGILELFQYHRNGSPDYIYEAPVGSTAFATGPALAAQMVDGGTLLGASEPSMYDDSPSTPEPWSFLLLGLGLIGLGLWGHRVRPGDPRGR